MVSSTGYVVLLLSAAAAAADITTTANVQDNQDYQGLISCRRSTS